MNKFDLLTFEKIKHQDGIQAIAEFPNGFGASVIKSDTSFGGKSGLFELAVLDNENGNINSTTDITDDVIGWQDEDDIDRVLTAISKLNPDGTLPNGVKI
tara:strand:+ start:351 stop:650 length:300 start_codon:yes stop_codon:yes gene_type:complete